MSEVVTRTGRGGAGNIFLSNTKPPAPRIQHDDITTPTITAPTYTTGRGGCGNMAKHDPKYPEITRQAQDVSPPLAVMKEDRPERIVMIGRGGLANAANQRTTATQLYGDEATPTPHARKNSKDEVDTKVAEETWGEWIKNMFMKTGR